MDADYKFLWADVASNGSCSDVLNECQLKNNIIDGTIHFPNAYELPGDDRDTPYFISYFHIIFIFIIFICLPSRHMTSCFGHVSI